jgi:short chain dehydrogenase
MSVIAIVGAGPGLGLSIARRFGREGFSVALISRTPANLDRLVAELAASGIQAAGFAGDVLDRPALTAGLAAAADRFGPVDVLEYSPAPHGAPPGLGASSAVTMPPMGNVGIAGAGLRNYALALNAALADRGVYAAHVPLGVWIGSGGPQTQPDTIAELYWDLYLSRDRPERLYAAP